jgi:hypothetical protein
MGGLAASFFLAAVALALYFWPSHEVATYVGPTLVTPALSSDNSSTGVRVVGSAKIEPTFCYPVCSAKDRAAIKVQLDAIGYQPTKEGLDAFRKWAEGLEDWETRERFLWLVEVEEKATARRTREDAEITEALKGLPKVACPGVYRYSDVGITESFSIECRTKQ